MNSPYGIYVDSNGHLYVAEYGNHRISRWLPSKTSILLVECLKRCLDATSGIKVAGETGMAGRWLYQLNRPTALIFDQSDNMFIFDSGNRRIQKWPPGSTFGITVVSISNSNDPKGISFDTYGNLVMVDHCNVLWNYWDNIDKKFVDYYPSMHWVVSYNIECRKYEQILKASIIDNPGR